VRLPLDGNPRLSGPLLNNPVHTFAVTDRCNNTLAVRSPDPGIMITGVYSTLCWRSSFPRKRLAFCTRRSPPDAGAPQTVVTVWGAQVGRRRLARRVRRDSGLASS
jgi:hypothetical protein